MCFVSRKRNKQADKYYIKFKKYTEVNKTHQVPTEATDNYFPWFLVIM